MLNTGTIFRYDYGSPGVLGYYQATLQDIVQYPDARTTLFHNFREFGNALLFCLMTEQVRTHKLILRSINHVISVHHVVDDLIPPMFAFEIPHECSLCRL